MTSLDECLSGCTVEPVKFLCCIGGQGGKVVSENMHTPVIIRALLEMFNHFCPGVEIVKAYHTMVCIGKEPGRILVPVCGP